MYQIKIPRGSRTWSLLMQTVLTRKVQGWGKVLGERGFFPTITLALTKPWAPQLSLCYVTISRSRTRNVSIPVSFPHYVQVPYRGSGNETDLYCLDHHSVTGLVHPKSCFCFAHGCFCLCLFCLCLCCFVCVCFVCVCFCLYLFLFCLCLFLLCFFFLTAVKPSASALGSFRGLHMFVLSLAVRNNSLRISYCKQRTNKAWDHRGYVSLAGNF